MRRQALKTRAEQIKLLKSGEPFDVLVVGAELEPAGVQRSGRGADHIIPRQRADVRSGGCVEREFDDGGTKGLS